MSGVLQNQEGTGRKLQKRDYIQEHCVISRLPPWWGSSSLWTNKAHLQLAQLYLQRISSEEWMSFLAMAVKGHTCGMAKPTMLNIR